MEDKTGEVDQLLIRSAPSPSYTKGSAFKWFGGKDNLASWIVGFLPRRGITKYVEPFAGSASVFFANPVRYRLEVLNDLDERIVNFYRVLQDRDKFNEFLHRILWTPYAKSEFVRAYEIMLDPDSYSDIDRAWAFYVQMNMSFAAPAEGPLTPGRWGRSKTDEKTTRAWVARYKKLIRFHLRLLNAQIDQADAMEVIRYYDSPETVFYVDPPYVLSTRKSHGYKHEVDDVYHQKLVTLLTGIKGKALVSGYYNSIYKKLTDSGWKVAKKKLKASSLPAEFRVKDSAIRYEYLWMNFNPAKDR